jgi:hypothetical protein
MRNANGDFRPFLRSEPRQKGKGSVHHRLRRRCDPFERDLALDPRQGNSTSHSRAAHVAFERIETLGPSNVRSVASQIPAHAIAVYASPPLSPVATQHPLPNRCPPLTWAGLSPAGHNSLRLAPSFDYQFPTSIHSRHTVSRAAIITGPRKRPTNPNDCIPPTIPISTNRNGSCAVPPISAG